MSWCVYILECSDGSYYTGITNDIKKRVDTHNSGKGAKYTRARLPVNMIESSACDDRIAALRLEAHVKKQPRALKLETLKKGAI